MKTKLQDEMMADTINKSMRFVKATSTGECWQWRNGNKGFDGDPMYCVVHDNFTNWFSTNSLEIADKYMNGVSEIPIPHKHTSTQLTLF